jgi:hypothetical protein
MRDDDIEKFHEMVHVARLVVQEHPENERAKGYLDGLLRAAELLGISREEPIS